jgi:hypothetical protein
MVCGRCKNFDFMVFLSLRAGGQKGFLRRCRNSFRVNGEFSIFKWPASIPFGLWGVLEEISLAKAQRYKMFR